MKNYLSVCVYALLFAVGNIANAQSLEAVLSSIQERKWVLEQREKVGWELSGSNGQAPEFDKITWDGASDFPAEGALATVSIETRVKLLNQAVREFEKLRSYYLNIAPSRLEGAANVKPPALINVYDELSLPSPGRVDSANFHSALQGLAFQVSRLRVVPWIGKYQMEIGVDSDVVEDHDTGADSISSGDWAIDFFDAAQVSSCVEESWILGGDNYISVAAPDGRQTKSVNIHRPKNVEIKLIPGGITEGVNGEVCVLDRLSYNPAGEHVTLDGTPVENDGRWQILSKLSANGIHDYGIRPVVSVSGEWQSDPPENPAQGYHSFNTFVPSGINLLVDSEDQGISWAYIYGGMARIHHKEHALLFTPAFTKGLDSPVFQTVLDSLAGVSSGFPQGIGEEFLGGGAVKWGIHLGAGENNFQSSGSLVITHPVAIYDATGWAIKKDSSVTSLVGVAESISTRFISPIGFNSHLSFSGVDGDFQLIYETRYDEGRQSLKDWTAEPWAYSKGWESSEDYLKVWARPRLRQVLGRDLLIDVVAGENDYSQEIKLYRRPLGHQAQYDSDGYVDTNGLTLWKTYSASNPSVGGDGFPASGQKFEVSGPAGKSICEGSREEASDPFSDWYSLYPVWTTARKTAAGVTLATEVWTAGYDAYSGYMEALLVTATVDGVSQATRRYTYADDSRDLFDPLARVTKLELNPGVNAVITDYIYPVAGEASWGTRWPKQVAITDPLEPDRMMEWDITGIPKKYTQGDWATDWSLESGQLKAISKHDTSTYATTWTEWNNGATQIITYSAPDGTISSKTHSSNSITTVDLYSPTATGAGEISLALKQTENGDGTGSIHKYTLASDGSLTTEIKSGLLNGNSITKGIKTIRSSNARGYPVSATSHDIDSNTQLSGVTYGSPTAWGAPTNSTDYTTGLQGSWIHDGAYDRLTGSTDVLGNIIDNIAYDTLGRPTGYTWKGNVGNINYTGLGISSTLDITDRNYSSSSQWDSFGRPVSGSTTSGGTNTWNISRTAAQFTTTHTDTVTGASRTVKTRSADGSLEESTGATLPFGGVNGSGITVSNGLLKTTRQVKNFTASYETVYTDAWGRTRKIEVPSTKSPLIDVTYYSYSPPSQPLKRITIDHPSGIRSITEIEPFAATGAVTRGGIDIGTLGNGVLGGADRYTEATTIISGGKIQTTTELNEDSGKRIVLFGEYDPSTGNSNASINGGEIEVTKDANYAAKQIVTHTKKNGVVVSTKTENMNHLWQPDLTTITGTGIPSVTIDPTFREDGSISAISNTIGGAITSADINAEGVLTALNDPLLGDVLGGHSFANGEQTFTINGTTYTSKLDGTQRAISGADVMAHDRSLAVNGNNIEETIDPATGSNTKIVSNAAGAQTDKDYAAGTDISNTWLQGGFLDTYSLARGGSIQLGYSSDGAMDLTSIQYPAATSTGFGGGTSLTHSFTYDRAGRVKTIGDSSGNRMLTYAKGRLDETDWTSGYMDAYKVDRSHDAYGRLSGITLLKNGQSIHTINLAYNGNSNEIAGINATDFTSTYQRNTGRHITGITRGSVVQNWSRGATGRISNTSSSVTGAPDFTYNDPNLIEDAMDSRGRRNYCVTEGSSWDYVYGIAGQLESARHPSLGTFIYDFDGIGRRKGLDQGTVNQNNALNQFKQISHSQQKQLYIAADPAARLWVNGNEMTPFNGGWVYNLTGPGTEGGWVPWHVEGVLEGAGDPGAGVDAKAEFSGLAWIPPAQEDFTYDDDGNRESSALWIYHWDGRNRLVGARTKNYDTDPQGWDVSFDYDAEGRRYKKNVKKYKDGELESETHTTFVYDGWDLLYEIQTNAQGATLLERKYVWGNDISGNHGGAGGAGGLLLIREIRGEVTEDYNPLFDGSGHLVALADANGILQAEYAYGPFGELIHAKGPKAQSNPWRYATKYYDHETGLYYFGHRYYDPITGQWLSREPLGEIESLNLYAYCHNDPINKVDVLGLADVAVDGNGNLTGAGRSILRMIEAGSVSAAAELLYELQVTAELGNLENRLYRNPTPKTGISYTRLELFQKTEAATSLAGNAARRELGVLHLKGGYKQFAKDDRLILVPKSANFGAAIDTYESFLPITRAGARAGRETIASSLLHARRVWAPSAVVARAGFGLGEGLGVLDAYTALSGNRVYFDDLSYWHTYETTTGDRALAIAGALPWGKFFKPLKGFAKKGLAGASPGPVSWKGGKPSYNPEKFDFDIVNGLSKSEKRSLRVHEFTHLDQFVEQPWKVWHAQSRLPGQSVSRYMLERQAYMAEMEAAGKSYNIFKPIGSMGNSIELDILYLMGGAAGAYGIYDQIP